MRKRSSARGVNGRAARCGGPALGVTRRSFIGAGLTLPIAGQALGEFDDHHEVDLSFAWNRDETVLTISIVAAADPLGATKRSVKMCDQETLGGFNRSADVEPARRCAAG